MRGKIVKTNFNAGEFSPLLNGRTDLDRYYNSCRTMKNCVPITLGSATTRPGFKYIAEVEDSNTKSYLYPFKATDDDNYILEFSDLKIRVYKDQARVGAFEVTTTYAIADVPNLKLAQSADTLYIVHESYSPRKLIRFSNTSWVLNEVDFIPGPLSESSDIAADINASADLTPGATTGSLVDFTCDVAIFQAGDVGRLIEPIPSVAGTTYLGASATIVSIGTTSPNTVVTCSITSDFPSTAKIDALGWKLVGTPGGGLTPSAQGPRGKLISLDITTPAATYVDLLDADGGEWNQKGATNIYYKNNTADISPPAAEPGNVLQNGSPLLNKASILLFPGQWTWGDFDTLGYNTIYVRLTDDTDPDSKYATGGASYVQYSVESSDIFRSVDVGKYISINSGLVRLTSASGGTAQGQIITALTSTTESFAWEMLQDVLDFNDTDAGSEYPSVVCFYEDRLWLGGSPSYPQTVWGSATGQYERFIYGTTASDAVEYTILSRELTKIKWLEPRDSLFIGTGGGIWRMDGGALEAAITPTNVNVRQVTTEPSSTGQGISVGSSVLYIHDQEQKMMEIEQDTDIFGKKANDISILADHLTVGNLSQIVYQSDPYGIVWAVNGDGRLIGVTYLKSQGVVAFHQHVTDGTVESIAVINGATYDELWLVVKRNINGSDVRHIEVMQQFFERTGDTTLDDAIHSDASITVNQAASKTVSGLSHLEGETVTIIADGKRHKNLTVASGVVTLDYTAEKIHVGLPYDQLIVSQYIETIGAPSTSFGTKQRLISVGTMLNKTMIAQVGRDENNLKVVENRTPTTGLSTAPDLMTKIVTTLIDGNFGDQTSMTIFNDAPTPMTVVSLIATIEVGDA
jgi:hypothetical protein